MAAVLMKLLNLSMSASWLVLAVLVLRLISKRSPKWVNVLLWGIVALRLVLPFSIESALSLIPSAETVSPAAVQFAPAPTITSGVSVIDNAVNPSLSEHFAAVPTASVNPLYVWAYLAGWVWLIGLGAMLLYALVSYLRLRRRVSVSLPVQDHIYLCDAISSPFILGIVKPHIYLPSGLDEVQRQNVLAHERAHLARHDHWWKPLGFALLAVYWFNPVLWLAYTLLCRDIELACDERVIRTMDESAVKTYSAVLLACSIPRKAVITCPLAFGEVGVKERVRNALHYKKPAFWVVAASVTVCVVVAVCFLTDPPTDTDAAGLVGFHREQVTYADVTDASGAQPSSVQLTAEETNAVYALLDAMQYKRLGAASAMQGCYARLYFISAAGERCEVMLSEREMLVNPITGGKTARLYELRSGSAELRDYLLECISASNAAEEDFSISGTVFSYGGESWDLAEQSPAITSLLGCDAVGQYVVITGHGGPKNAFYFIFDTEIRRFSNAFVGTHLVWQNDDLSTAVYAYGGNILSIDGRTLAELDLAENEYVYDLVYSQDGTVLTVSIVSNEETERVVRLNLPSQNKIDNLHGNASTLLTAIDFDGDGTEEEIFFEEVAPGQIYRIYVEGNGSERWSAELGLAHVGWDSYFLYRDGDTSAILRYNPAMFQGFCNYDYELFSIGADGQRLLTQRSVEFDVNPDSDDPWPPDAQVFADEVNALLEKSTLLISTLDGELHLEDGTTFRCVSPS